MGVSKIDEIKAPQSRANYVSELPTAPYLYYGSASNDVDSTEWRGGEMCYLNEDERLYIQTATSGTTATWVRFLTEFTAD